MWSRVYRNHFILAFPSFDTRTNGWAPQADVSWGGGAVRDSEFLRSSNRLMSETEAIAFALQMAAAWIDSRLDGRHQAHEKHGQLVDMVEALKDRLSRHNAGRLLESRRAKAPAELALTFEQFKSALAHQGLKDETLKKSYAALVKLRQNNRLSWADARRKVEHSRKTLGAAPAPTRQAKAVRLPLTERDWRRLG